MQQNLFSEGDMPEYGDIFDYQLSTMAFSYLTIGFMAAYAFIVIWVTARSTDPVVSTLQPA